MHSDGRFLVRLFDALNRVKLEAIVVGATAAVLQGCPLMTLDVDLLIRDTKRNREKLRALAKEIGGAPPTPVSDLTSVERISGAEAPVDVLFDELAGGLGFASVRSRATRLELGGKSGLVASLDDVIASKKAAARPKDAVHLLLLAQTLELRKNR